MTLCATIAGPRRWRLRELPLRKAFVYLFIRDPKLLLGQIAPVGQSLTTMGSSVLIRSERPAGMLYLFANDLWQTYLNNSGELELELTRLDQEPEQGEATWTLPVTGPWRFLPLGCAAEHEPQGRTPRNTPIGA
jgi:hypothetical protein